MKDIILYTAFTALLFAITWFLAKIHTNILTILKGMKKHTHCLEEEDCNSKNVINSKLDESSKN